VDAEDALRRLRDAKLSGPRVHFLMGELALGAEDPRGAVKLWRKGLEMGGEDYRVRVALARLLDRFGKEEEAMEQLARAEEIFPGFEEPSLSAELMSASIHSNAGREDEAMAARERRLAWDAGDYPTRRSLAAWHAEAGRHAQASELLRQANEIDPFSRSLHMEWARALADGGSWEAALREWQVAQLVPPALNVDGEDVITNEARAECLAGEAVALNELGRKSEARERAAEALGFDAKCEAAEDLLEELDR
jgi:tetratricopeptide (TPR) repeat protein